MSAPLFLPRALVPDLVIPKGAPLPIVIPKGAPLPTTPRAPLVQIERPAYDRARDELRVSGSRTEDWRLCKRRWGFAAIDSAPRAQNKYAALGDAVHKLRELYLLYGTMPTNATREGAIALAGLDKLPPPRLPFVETRFEFMLGAHFRFTGRIDFLVANDDPTRLWGQLGVPLVGDHKTTSRKMHVKTAERLTAGDPQATLYSMYAMFMTGASVVDLHWSYMIKEKTPRALQVYARITKTQVEDSFATLLSDAQEMLQVARISGIRAVDLEPNVKACEVFGGCPYKAICPLTVQQKFGAIMSDPQTFPFPQPNGAMNGAPQQLPPGVQQGPDGSLWQPGPGGNWVPYQQQTFSPPPTPQSMPAPVSQAQQASEPSHQEYVYAAQLVTSKQALPSNVPPGVVRAYSMFTQAPHLASQYVQATQQAAPTPPASGVVPGDAPQANQNATTPEPTRRRKASAATALPPGSKDVGAEIAVSLNRIANALEGLRDAAQKAAGSEDALATANTIANAAAPVITQLGAGPPNFTPPPNFPPAGLPSNFTPPPNFPPQNAQQGAQQQQGPQGQYPFQMQQG